MTSQRPATSRGERVVGMPRVHLVTALLSCALALVTIWVMLNMATAPVNEPVNQPAPVVPSTSDDPSGHRLVPCPSEDQGSWCYWDASVRGNGRGQSFWRDGNGDWHPLPTK